MREVSRTAEPVESLADGFWLDGPKVALYIDARIRGPIGEMLDPSSQRRLSSWRRGDSAKADTVERVLEQLPGEPQLWELPDDCWLPKGQGGSGRLRDERRKPA